MPIYEYACGKCGHEFEAEQRITEDPLKTCPECRSRQVKRLISQTSFVLKGGGWYSDLYSTGKGKPKEKADASGAGAKSEAKPADKAKDTGKETGKDKGKGSPKAAA
ncbi:MAG TPA: zinc ribbon domain-containing protein [Myxococcota bacterium]